MMMMMTSTMAGKRNLKAMNNRSPKKKIRGAETRQSPPLSSGKILWLLPLFAAFLLPSCGTPGRGSRADSEEIKTRGAFSKLYAEGDRRALEVGAQPGTLDELRDRASAMKSKLSADIESSDDDDDREDIEERLELVEFAEDWLSRTRHSNPTSKELLSVSMQVERVLNEVDAAAEERKNDSILTASLNYMATAMFGHSLPALSESKRNSPLGMRSASREAGFLYNSEAQQFYSADQLAGMSPEQVALLDVSPGHPAWHTEQKREQLRDGRMQNFEKWMQRGVKGVLGREDEVPGGQNWNITTARRVLFMDEVYKSATSPKSKAEDAYGVEWKIKWGDEVQSEAVASRLYLMAGAKMTDLVFVGDPGPRGMVLVLSEEGEYEDEKAEEGAEREPETVEQLVKTLDDFYGFDVVPYIHSHGVITRKNVDSVLRYLPASGEQKYRKSQLIGRHWVSFREYLVELRPDGFVRRENGSKMSDFAAKSDRVARGLYLLSLWMSNRDVKDDNNKAFYIKRASDGRIVDYREGHHDLGVTFGTMGASTEINSMKTGKGFMNRDLFGSKFRSRQIFIYKPEAWEEATWADCKWMARKIAVLSIGEIREAVAASKWPDFMQQALVYKLVNRRDRIAELYGVSDLLDARMEPPSVAVDLGSPSQIASIEKRYRLQSGSLANELQRMGVGSDYSETLVYQGEVEESENSAVIRQLTIQHHPAGLADRYRRMLDTPPDALTE